MDEMAAHPATIRHMPRLPRFTIRSRRAIARLAICIARWRRCLSGVGHLARPARAFARAALPATCVLVGGVASAQSFGVATWNLAWLMDAPTHQRWAQACRKHGWPAAGTALPADARADLEGLPYCDVHNGMAFPREGCASDRDGWPRKARYPPDHPCRETADLANPAAYAGKLAALRAMFARLDASGVRLVALQEVFDADAVRAVLPPRWSVATTRELAGTPGIAQHVGVAWRAPAAVRDLRAVTSLADSGLPLRPLRPGLSFAIDVAGKPVRVLVVHLKAGCRNRDLDAPLSARDAALAPARQDAAVTDCAILRYQLPALEAWIDANAARDFALLGDFNRTLAREPVADSATYRTRLDGTSAADPLGTCMISRNGARATIRCSTRTRAMFPELNDGAPAGAVLWRARPAKGGGHAASCRLASGRRNLAHNGIDHVLVSASLKARLTPAALSLDIVNYGDDGGPLRLQPADVQPSDHCPHVVTWAPREEGTK